MQNEIKKEAIVVKKPEAVSEAPKKGRPAGVKSESRKMEIEIKMEGEFLILKVPKKLAARLLFGELI
jgi:hypothetical protein